MSVDADTVTVQIPRKCLTPLTADESEIAAILQASPGAYVLMSVIGQCRRAFSKQQFDWPNYLSNKSPLDFLQDDCGNSKRQSATSFCIGNSRNFCFLRCCSWDTLSILSRRPVALFCFLHRGHVCYAGQSLKVEHGGSRQAKPLHQSSGSANIGL